jgi:hypothetical protein
MLELLPAAVPRSLGSALPGSSLLLHAASCASPAPLAFKAEVPKGVGSEPAGAMEAPMNPIREGPCNGDRLSP